MRSPGSNHRHRAGRHLPGACDLGCKARVGCDHLWLPTSGAASSDATERSGRMRFRAMIGALALAGAALMSVGFGAASAGAETMTCAWGGTPLDPTGLITLSPGVTNLPSTGPIQFTAT